MSDYTGAPVIVEQSCGNNGQFNGTLPAVTPASDTDGVRIYAPLGAVGGGRFSGGPSVSVGATEVQQPWGKGIDYRIIEQMIVNMTGLAGAQSWNVDIVDAAGHRTTWKTGAGATTTLVNGDDERIVLAPDEWIEVTMTAPSGVGGCFVRIWNRRYAVYGSSR